MNNDRIKLACIGAGKMGQCAHLKNYARLTDECEITALAEPQQDKAEKVAARYGIPHVYGNAEELLSREQPDAIVASQPFSRHGVILEQLVQAGAPVFIEKPLASSVQTGQKIVRMAAESEMQIMVGYHKRSDPAVEYAQEQIENIKEQGMLGRMKYVRITMPPGDFVQHGFDDFIQGTDDIPPSASDPPPDDMDGETFKRYVSFVNFYIHQVNLLRFLMGETYQVAYADTGGILFVCESSSGITGTIEMNPFHTTRGWQEQALVCFERGYIKVCIPAPLAANRPGRVEVFTDPDRESLPELRIPVLKREHAMKNQARNFLAFVRGERPAPCGAEEALEDLKTAREFLYRKAPYVSAVQKREHIRRNV